MIERDFAPFMREAIALAEQGRWKACPNPTVGAVLVRDKRIVAPVSYTHLTLPTTQAV